MSVGTAAAAAVGGLGGSILDLIGVGKARLTAWKPVVQAPSQTQAAPSKQGPPILELMFDYNPTSFPLKVESKTTETPSSQDQSAPRTQLIGSSPETFDVELFYSRFEMPDVMEVKQMGWKKAIYTSLWDMKDDLFALVKAHPDTVGAGKVPCRPLVQFSWGPLSTKLSFVKSVDVTFEQFLPNGTPMRMKAKVSLVEAREETRAQNPTSGGRTARRTHTLLAGETLASVAWKEYANAGLWRAIAEENAIDDPLRLTPGTELLLPPADEAPDLA